MTEDERKTEAIRTVLIQGGAGEFYDVVEQVRKQFGLRVGAGLVEKVYLEMQSQSGTGGAPDAAEQEKVDRFVQEMGGVERARAALARWAQRQS